MAAPISVETSASGVAASDQKTGDIYGQFNTGYFGRGMDYAGILEKGMIPLTVLGVVVLLWMLKKKK